MRFVQRAVSRPNTCAVVPGRGAAEKEGFIDTGNELMGWDPHVYISMAGAREVARFIGWAAPATVDAQAELVAELKARVEQLEQELQEYDRRFAAIDLLESEGFTARKKVGRPKAKAA